MSNALAMVKDNKMTMEEVSEHVHIPLEDLQVHKQYEEDKKPNTTSKKQNKKTRSDTIPQESMISVLQEIRDLLKVIAAVK